MKPQAWICMATILVCWGMLALAADEAASHGAAGTGEPLQDGVVRQVTRVLENDVETVVSTIQYAWSADMSECVETRPDARAAAAAPCIVEYRRMGSVRMLPVRKAYEEAPNGERRRSVVEFAYDESFRLREQRHVIERLNATASEKEVIARTFEYDEEGRLIVESYSDSNRNRATYRCEYSRDGDYQVTIRTGSAGHGNVGEFRERIRDDGKRLHTVEKPAWEPMTDTRYEYDETGALKRAVSRCEMDGD